MRAGIFTAFQLWFAPLSGQRAGPLPHQAATVLSTLFFATLLSACTDVNVLMLSSESFPAQSSQVEVLDRLPTRPYVQIAVLSLNSWWLRADSRREKIAEKAATLGADAVVFGDTLLSTPSTAAPSVPSPSSPSKDTQTVLPGYPSMYEGTPDGDVRIYLVRGGGHGGGRGGGHGHGGGHWGSRSGPSGFRHWRHGPGPAFWGYGFYGPGWWGYGPYWGPHWGAYYYPSPYSYYGAYPYSGYGESTVTVGTAIHYKD